MSKKPSTTEFVKSFIVWFAIFYLSFSLISRFFGAPEPTDGSAEPMTKSPTSATINPEKTKNSLGNLVVFKVENTSDTTLNYTSPCQSELSESNTELFRIVNQKKLLLEDFSVCGESEINSFSLEPGQGIRLSFPYKNSEVFSEEGDYVLRLGLETEEGENILVESDIVVIESVGFFKGLFRTVISQPLFNLLVFFTQTLPGRSFGVAIVLVTILVRLLLFIPNQKALQSQRKLQTLQPQMEAIRKKYAKNQQMIAMKTMELYRTAKVNPMSSCLPMVLQLPILLGVYYIVQDGLSPHLRYLLYGFQSQADLGLVNSFFLGYNLQVTPLGAFDWTTFNVSWTYVLIPLVVALTQWFAIRMTLNRSAQDKTKPVEKKSKKTETATPDMAAQMQQMTGMMQWLMPGMIAFFTATFPAAVGLYWFTSTLFGIGQQKYVYWQMERMPEVRKKI